MTKDRFLAQVLAEVKREHRDAGSRFPNPIELVRFGHLTEAANRLGLTRSAALSGSVVFAAVKAHLAAGELKLLSRWGYVWVVPGQARLRPEDGDQWLSHPGSVAPYTWDRLDLEDFSEADFTEEAFTPEIELARATTVLGMGNAHAFATVVADRYHRNNTNGFAVGEEEDTVDGCTVQAELGPVAALAGELAVYVTVTGGVGAVVAVGNSNGPWGVVVDEFEISSRKNRRSPGGPSRKVVA